jgi:predicted RNA binding protein YcfA (HicA-like mRNA interferase family)
MPKLPRISGAEAITVFESLGFSVVRHKGNHVVLRKRNVGCVVPLHKELAVGTLRSALKQAQVIVEDFLAAYEQL